MLNAATSASGKSGSGSTVAVVSDRAPFGEIIEKKNAPNESYDFRRPPHSESAAAGDMCVASHA